jgi:hypothetical protein
MIHWQNRKALSRYKMGLVTLILMTEYNKSYHGLYLHTRPLDIRRALLCLFGKADPCTKGLG